jgi:hypothetical protein
MRSSGRGSSTAVSTPCQRPNGTRADRGRRRRSRSRPRDDGPIGFSPTANADRTQSAMLSAPRNLRRFDSTDHCALYATAFRIASASGRNSTHSIDLGWVRLPSTGTSRFRRALATSAPRVRIYTGVAFRPTTRTLRYSAPPKLFLRRSLRRAISSSFPLGAETTSRGVSITSNRSAPSTRRERVGRSCPLYEVGF